MNLDPYTRKLVALEKALDRAVRAVHLPDQTSEEVKVREDYARFRASRLAAHRATRDSTGLHPIVAGIRIIRGPFAGLVKEVRGEMADIQIEGCNEVQTVRCRSLTVLD